VVGEVGETAQVREFRCVSGILAVVTSIDVLRRERGGTVSNLPTDKQHKSEEPPKKETSRNGKRIRICLSQSRTRKKVYAVHLQKLEARDSWEPAGVPQLRVWLSRCSEQTPASIVCANRADGRDFRPRAKHKIFHFPLDLSFQALMRKRGLMTRREMHAHLHYFTKNTDQSEFLYHGE
jgi:hypothetical protein